MSFRFEHHLTDWWLQGGEIRANTPDMQPTAGYNVTLVRHRKIFSWIGLNASDDHRAYGTYAGRSRGRAVPAVKHGTVWQQVDEPRSGGLSGSA